MDAFKNIMDFQKQLAETYIPKDYLASFEKMLEPFMNLDPGKMFAQFKDAVGNLAKMVPMNNFQDFFKSLNLNSNDYLKVFQESFINPLKMFQDLMDKFKSGSLTSAAPKTSTTSTSTTSASTVSKPVNKPAPKQAPK